MNEQKKTLHLADERKVEKQYQEVLKARAEKISQYQGPANAMMVGKGLPPKPVYGDRLVGRVALAGPDNEILDGKSEFYIGETYAVVDGVNIFGWGNPIACTFYQGTDHYYLCPEVTAVRAFRRDRVQIIDFVDEALRPDAPAEPFPIRGELVVPAPPTLPKLPTADATKLTDLPVADQPPAAYEPTPGELPPIRAEALLREQMLAPRTTGLSSVLATLQPDQYELVTMSGHSSVVVEGHPGTGKTIVASHRAAYLVHDDISEDHKLRGNVLVVGPTPGYSHHVRGVINQLAGSSNRIAVLSLPELADLIIGVSEAPPTSVSRSYFDVGWEVAKFARSAIFKLRADENREPLPSEVFEALRSRAGLITSDKDWASYLRGLPEYNQARKLRVHSPLIAFIHWELQKPEAFARVEHVIVDEAQDVTPLEWLLLDEINEGDKWTVIGDLNQRRSDHTLPDWNQVLDHIAIEPDTPVRRMRRGYRSTKPILQFANRLLPRPERKINAFQEVGPEPSINAVKKNAVGDSVASEVERLLSAYPKGTLAVIGQSPKPVTISLRKRGWTSTSLNGESWSREGREVKVLSQEAARGLEFDAVIVVEPSEFPKNYGRFGPLYTALTRANRELSIVHSEKLPQELRRP